VPFLQPAFVRRLIELLGPHSICVPRVGEHHHPLAAVYRMEVLPAVRRLLEQDRLRPFFLFDAVSTRIVESDQLAMVDPACRTLRNLNAPSDYEAAIHSLEEETRDDVGGTC
jgi:molybdenum cofactor guanylyltransferase